MKYLDILACIVRSYLAERETEILSCTRGENRARERTDYIMRAGKCKLCCCDRHGVSKYMA